MYKLKSLFGRKARSSKWILISSRAEFGKNVCSCAYGNLITSSFASATKYQVFPREKPPRKWTTNCKTIARQQQTELLIANRTCVSSQLTVARVGIFLRVHSPLLKTTCLLPLQLSFKVLVLWCCRRRRLDKWLLETDAKQEMKSSKETRVNTRLYAYYGKHKRPLLQIREPRMSPCPSPEL